MHNVAGFVYEGIFVCEGMHNVADFAYEGRYNVAVATRHPDNCRSPHVSNLVFLSIRYYSPHVHSLHAP